MLHSSSQELPPISAGYGDSALMELRHLFARPSWDPSLALRPLFCPRLSTALHQSLQPLLPPSMCHGEMEIVSVKELADGSLLLSFGVLPDSTLSPSMDGPVASIPGGKLAIPSRLPSRFRRHSPIPVAAVGRRSKREGECMQETLQVNVPASTKGALGLPSRFKPSFVKRSPIPQRKDVRCQPVLEQPGQERSLMVNNVQNASASKQQSDTKASGTGSRKAGVAEGLPSRFVRKSPIPPRKHTSDPDQSSSEAQDPSTKALDKSSAAQHPRPKSNFHRRSPIGSVTSISQNLSSILDSHSRSSSSSSLDANPPTSLRAEAPENHADEAEGSGKSSNSQAQSASPPLGLVSRSDLRKCKLSELKSIAKSRGIKGYSKLKKGELLDLLKGHFKQKKGSSKLKGELLNKGEDL